MEQVGSKVKVIKQLFVVSAHNIVYIVGSTANGVEVAKIEDCGIEWENSLDSIYRIYDAAGNQIATVENCPVVVEYEVPE